MLSIKEIPFLLLVCSACSTDRNTLKLEDAVVVSPEEQARALQNIIYFRTELLLLDSSITVLQNYDYTEYWCNARGQIEKVDRCTIGDSLRCHQVTRNIYDQNGLLLKHMQDQGDYNQRERYFYKVERDQIVRYTCRVANVDMDSIYANPRVVDTVRESTMTFEDGRISKVHYPDDGSYREPKIKTIYNYERSNIASIVDHSFYQQDSISTLYSYQDEVLVEVAEMYGDGSKRITTYHSGKAATSTHSYNEKPLLLINYFYE